MVVRSAALLLEECAAVARRPTALLLRGDLPAVSCPSLGPNHPAKPWPNPSYLALAQLALGQLVLPRSWPAHFCPRLKRASDVRDGNEPQMSGKETAASPSYLQLILPPAHPTSSSSYLQPILVKGLRLALKHVL